MIENQIKEARRSIGTELRNMRVIAGLSQVQLAERIGITQHTVSKVENGVWNFGIDIVIRYAIAMDYDFIPLIIFESKH